MPKTLPDTDTALASKLAAELRTTFGQLKRKLRQHGGLNDFTSSQIAVILRLERDGPATVSSLARAEGMRPQSMSAVIAPLEEMGFVAGGGDPSDGRNTLMSLTKACKKRIEDGRAARQDWMTQAIQQKLSPQEQKKLSSAIHLLAKITADCPSCRASGHPNLTVDCRQHLCPKTLLFRGRNAIRDLCHRSCKGAVLSADRQRRRLARDLFQEKLRRHAAVLHAGARGLDHGLECVGQRMETGEVILVVALG